MKTVPSINNNEHNSEIINLIPQIISKRKHGILVLFTSAYIMKCVYNSLNADLKNEVLLQGSKPKMTLLKKHRFIIDKGERSIIFGLQSFAEGVDLPKNYCRCLIITKIPFSVPTGPIEKTFINWLKSMSHNAFFKHSLPEASLRLTQWAGRLVRTEDDEGEIIILDRRIEIKNYGQLLISNLPPFSRLKIERNS